ncbi:VanW family protein [Patescibacteria group bacterium]|nr:VanW family protein [Patescibacteria group bacterium]MBU1922145.1 VanW family protein [Patescibacteria group bacterium]
MDKPRKTTAQTHKKSLRTNILARIFSHWLSFAILALVVVGFVAATTSWAYAKVYEDRVFPGVKMGVLDLGGLTRDQAREKLIQEAGGLLENGFKISYDGTEFRLKTNIDNPTNPELNQELIIFDFDEMADQAMSQGRGSSWWKNIHAQTLAKTFGISLAAEYQIEEAAVEKIIKQEFKKFDSPAQDAQIIISFSEGSSEPDFTAEPEQAGQTLDYDAALAEIERQLLFLDAADITLAMSHEEPRIVLAEAQAKVDEIKDIMELAPVTLNYATDFEKFSWQFSDEDFATWLSLEKDEAGGVNIAFSREPVQTTLAEIGQKIEVEPRDAKFKMENGRVIEFVGSRDGIAIDWEATLDNFETRILTEGESDAEIKVAVSEPEVTIGDLNNLGIKELIGVGRSDFGGSPANRRHNIRVGSDMLHGLLIEPDEEFTTIGNLAPVTAASGYLPELVIKENKTIPEYGGGLCQIGTTMFRVAISAGLPITERQPHSYRVVYYEPAGKDAAVYEMHPDVRFINDTGNHILIQTHIQGDDLIFEFWGTNDGREAYQSDSRIYNITSPPPLKEVETLDLAPGEKKCTEGAHAGADAEFDYKVTYADGRIEEETFSSHYRAWGAVCLIGVEELSEPPEGEEGEEGTDQTEDESEEDGQEAQE